MLKKSPHVCSLNDQHLKVMFMTLLMLWGRLSTRGLAFNSNECFGVVLFLSGYKCLKLKL